MLAWLLATALALPPGHTEVMLLWPDVTATVEVAGQTSGLPTTLVLPAGEHQAALRATDGRVQRKVFTVAPTTGHPQVVDLAKAQALAVPGGKYTFVRAGAEGLALTVDGVDGGTLPATLVLSSGPHEVTVALPEGPKTWSLTLRPDGDVTEVVLK